jgi:hypothetical protein
MHIKSDLENFQILNINLPRQFKKKIYAKNKN